jgi:hypothetical protein
MKWSQGLCTAILIEGLRGVAPPAGSQAGLDGDFLGFAVDPASRPNALAADWRPSPPAGRFSILNLARFGLAKPRPPMFWG